MSVAEERPAPAHGPFFIVVNAGSGDRDAEERETVVRDVLTRAGRPHRIWRAGRIGELHAFTSEAVALAAEQNGTVVAAGGDGTINLIAQAVFAARCPFAVLPQGTFNYFGRAHGIPVDTADAAKLLIDGIFRPVQVGLVNDRLFLVNASVGLYPKLLEKREEHKQRFGRTRGVALLSALTTVMTPPPQLLLTLEEDGTRESMHVSTLLVENNPLQLREVGLPEADAVSRGGLAAVVVKARGVLQMLGVVGKALAGRLSESENVSSFPFDQLQVTTPRRKRIKVAADGEISWMVPPLLFSVAPRPLQLIVPGTAKGTKAP